MTIRIEPCEDGAGRRAKAAIRLAADPHGARSIAEDVYDAALDPAGISLLARDGGEPVGAAEVCRMAISREDYERLWARVWVLPERRREGIGTYLYGHVRAHAEARAKTGLESEVYSDDAGGLAFALARGFREDWREHVLRRPLNGSEGPPEALPHGVSVRVIGSAAPELDEVHEIACEALADVPSGSMPMEAGEVAWWRRVWIDGPAARAGGLFVAELDGHVAGYALLLVSPARPDVGYHAMTAVRRSARGRGIAGALKDAQLRWAIAHGLRELDTHNAATNAAMQAVNLRLGYEPVCDLIGVVIDL